MYYGIAKIERDEVYDYYSENENHGGIMRDPRGRRKTQSHRI